MKWLSFRRAPTRIFALWTILVTGFFSAQVLLGKEGDPPTDQDPATIVAPVFTGYGGGGHSSSRGSGTSYSFGK